MHDELMPFPMPDLQQVPMDTPKPQSQPTVANKEQEKPAVAPLFVKIDRYRHILNSIGNLKTALMIIKNSLDTMHQIERVRDDTYGIINDMVEKMGQKLLNLDDELLRPAGFHETNDASSEHQDIKTIDATVADLKGQIDQLKSELTKMI